MEVQTEPMEPIIRIKEIFTNNPIPLYKASLVSEEPTLKCLDLNPEDVVTKRWVFRNEGVNEWPRDLAFVCLSPNSGLCEQSIIRITDLVLPGQELPVEVKIKAPAYDPESHNVHFVSF
jgi:Ig-like domain from next to BRCA1 gene